MARAASENFPVASRLLPAPLRAHLLAIYGFARLVDELGDDEPGDRLAALDWLEVELDRAFAGTASHPLLAELQPTIAECGLPREPFERLIEANRIDQRVPSYETWHDLLGYCHLSADPVGELVLHVFGAATPERIALSDAICTALQLTEHWQDVREDLARARVYLPLEDLARVGCTIDDLVAPCVGPRLRAVLALVAGRTARLFGAASRWSRPCTAGAARRRRLCRRRPRRARRDRARGLRGARRLPPAHAAAHRRGDRPRAGARRRRMSEAARRHCAQVTREQAANFYYGMRLLGPDKRAALFAVYAFARRIDDIGDGALATERKRELLEREAQRCARPRTAISCWARSPTRGERFGLPSARCST